MKRWWLLVVVMGMISACAAPFRLIGPATLTHEAGTPFVDPGVIVPDDQPWTLTGAVDPLVLGETTLTYTWTTASKVSTLTRRVKVLDTTPPTITLDGETSPVLCPNAPFVESGVLVSDTFDVEVARSLRIRFEGNQVIYTATDASGNTATASRTLIRQDTQAPTLTLRGYETMTVPQNSLFQDPGVRVSDNCADLSDRVIVDHTVDTSTLGTYPLTYSVTDDGGNTVTLTRQVEVIAEAQTTVYLTFDDGPSLNTASVLDSLADYGVNATFFVVKRSSRYDDLLVRAALEGHTIGLHTYSHNYDQIYASLDAYLNDLQRISDHVYALTGIRSMILRFPGGSSNRISEFNPGIMTKVTTKVNELGYHYFDWNVSSGDGDSTNTAAFIAERTLDRIKRGKVNVLLLHDGGGSSETAEALPQILDYLVSINALILPITLETPVVQHNVQN